MNLKRNIIANYFGRLSTVLLGIAFVPIYLHILGIEAYGLIGIYLALQALVLILDIGFGTTLNRQLALYKSQGNRAAEMRDLTRTLEWFYWGGAVAIAAILLILAPLAAEHWIDANALTTSEIRRALSLMALSLAFQLPFSLYGGGLLGLQRQLTYNVTLTSAGAFRHIGTVAVLWFVSPTVWAFFGWHAVASIVQSISAGGLLWRGLGPPAGSTRFRLETLSSVWSFALGVGGFAAIGALLSQVDKVVVSALLPLESFGHYALAGVLGSAIYFLATPFFMAYFPRFTEAVGTGSILQLRGLYRQATQLLSTMLIPVAVIVAFFAEPLMLAWTRDAAAASQAAPIARLLALSAAFVGLGGLPYSMQLANGWTRLAVIVGAATLAISIPVVVVATWWYGAVGAAASWLAINATYTLSLVHLMHRRLLPDEKGTWYARAVIVPALTSGAIAAIGLLAMPSHLTGIWAPVYLALVGIAAVAATGAANPIARRSFKGMYDHIVRPRTAPIIQSPDGP